MRALVLTLLLVGALAELVRGAGPARPPAHRGPPTDDTGGATGAEVLLPNREPDAPLDTADTGPEFTREDVDVLVIGSGPAGLSAALAARELDAGVVVMERAARPGDGILFAGRFMAAGTAWQELEGIVDSPAIAATEWSAITGVDGDTPAVTTFLEASAGTLSWLEGYGLTVLGVSSDPDGGDTDRMHSIDTEGAREALLDAYDGDLRTRVEVTELVVEDGRVVGAIWENLDTGELGEIRAGAVVVATGGFLRDRARVELWRPELAGRRLLYETNPQSDGGGLPFLEAVGAGFASMENSGVYVHALQDPELEEGEALVLRALTRQLVVDEAGSRFMDEDDTRSLDLFGGLPSGEIWMITTDERAAVVKGSRPAYNWADPGVAEDLTLDELATSSDEVFIAASLAELADLIGVDAAGLEATVEEVNDLVALGETDAWGRDFTGEEPWESDSWWGIRVTPGLAKAYGGVATDVDAAVLDEDGEPIPGLYAAGEVAGMVPDGGAGTGFGGTVAACYTFGRIAGTNAATEALGAGRAR